MIRRRAKGVRDHRARVIILGGTVARDVVAGATGGGMGGDHLYPCVVVAVARTARTDGARACDEMGCAVGRVAGCR